MRAGSELLLIVAGGFFLWLAVTGRLANLPNAFNELVGQAVFHMTRPAVLPGTINLPPVATITGTSPS